MWGTTPSASAWTSTATGTLTGQVSVERMWGAQVSARACGGGTSPTGGTRSCGERSCRMRLRLFWGCRYPRETSKTHSTVCFSSKTSFVCDRNQSQSIAMQAQPNAMDNGDSHWAGECGVMWGAHGSVRVCGGGASPTGGTRSCGERSCRIRLRL